MKDWYLDLQRFAEGGEGAGDGGAEGAADAGVTGVDAAPQPRRRAKSNPLANVKFGIDPSAKDTTQQVNSRDAAGTENAQDAGAQAKLSFEELLKSDPEYKADYDARVKKAVDGRFAKSRQMEGRLSKMQPIIEAMAAHYGMNVSDPSQLDLDGLLNAVTQDRKMYEDEAVREGVPVELLMQRKQLERQQAAFNAQQRQISEENAARQEMNELMTAAVALKATIPDFDINREMENPAFARMALKPPRGVGLPLESAYYAVHHAEIEQARRQQQYQSMQTAVHETTQKVANAVASGSMRPSENGMGGNAAAVTRSDPRTLSRQERAEIKRRVERGEKIYF